MGYTRHKKKFTAKPKAVKTPPEKPPAKAKSKKSAKESVVDTPATPYPKPRKIKIVGPAPPEDAAEDGIMSSPSITPPPPIELDELEHGAAETLMWMTNIPMDNLEKYGNWKPENFSKSKRRFEEVVEEEEDEEEEDEEEEGEDEEELSQSSEEEKTDEEAITIKPFKIEFSVLYDGANESLTSDISWEGFISQLADTMSIAPKQVSVAYKFSTETRAAPYKHLSSVTHLNNLFCQAGEARNKLAKSRSQKNFVVELKCLDLNGGSNSAKKLDVKVSKKKKKSRKESDSGSNASSGNEVIVEGKKVKSSIKKSGSQWVAELERNNACTEHPGSTCIKLSTGHHQLSKTDLGTWAIFLEKGYPSTTQPPPGLKLQDAPKPTQAPSTPSVLPPVTHPVPHAPPVMHYGSAPYGPQYPPPYPGFFPPFLSYAYPPTPMAHQTTAQFRDEPDLPSSDPPEELEDVTLFPHITPWLVELDSGPQGRDGHNFSQYAPDFEHEKFIRISDLEDIPLQSLLEMCVGMANGTATKILSYTKRDTENICKREQRRLHGIAHTPRRHL